jgi:hypothetical protein
MSDASNVELHPEDLRQMAVALDIAWGQLSSDADRNDAMRRRLAAIIVDYSRQGERDPVRLSEMALANVALSELVGE